MSLLLLAALVTVAAPLTANAAFTASVNRTFLASYETVELTLRTDESTSQAPDLEPLEWSFDILGTRQQSQTRIINGQKEYSRDWVVTLAPKQPGTLVIPPITLGDQQSEPIPLSVSNQRPDDSGGATDPLLMKAEVSSESIYVQQELLLTLQILFSVPLYDDNRLSSMDINDALIQQLGETRKLDTIIDGIRYRGFELKYSIHPQSVGEMVIPSLTFTGVAAEPRDPFASIFSSGGKPVIARSPEIRIEVKPRPGNYPAGETWLPARNLTIQEKWSQPLASLTVGDAITRTITVDADGLSAAQLPPVLMPQPEGVNSYPDKSGTEDGETVNGVLGQRTDSIAMIPTRPGNITLPAIEYIWFDTDSGEIKSSRLPATQIEVAPDAKVQTTPSISQVISQAPTAPVSKAIECMEFDPGFWRSPGVWQSLTTLFALLWLATLGIWRFRSGTASSSTAGEIQTGKAAPLQFRGKTSEALAFSRLEAACQQNDVRQTLNELKNWSRLYLNSLYLNDETLTSLTDCLNKLGSPELNSICDQLSASLYAAKPCAANSEALSEALLITLLEACRQIRNTAFEQETDQTLGKLYPE